MTEFGGEVSDLWGPAPVATKAGKYYYITFMDDKTHLTRSLLSPPTIQSDSAQTLRQS